MPVETISERLSTTATNADISDTLAAIATEGKAAYRKLVLSIVDGLKPAREAILSTLASAGRSPDDLQLDVNRVQSRKQAADNLVEAESLRQQAEKMKPEREAAAKALADYLREAQSRAAVLTEAAGVVERRYGDLAHRATKLRIAGNRTLESTSPPDLHEKILAAQRTLEDLQREHARCSKLVEHAPAYREEAAVVRKDLERLTKVMRPLPNGATPAILVENRNRLSQLDRALQEVEAAEGNLPSVRQELAAAEKEFKALCQSRYDWRNVTL